jgi:hypothetical protein
LRSWDIRDITMNFMVYVAHLVLLRQWNLGGYDMQLGSERQEMHTEVWWGNLF